MNTENKAKEQNSSAKISNELKEGKKIFSETTSDHIKKESPHQSFEEIKLNNSSSKSPNSVLSNLSNMVEMGTLNNDPTTNSKYILNIINEMKKVDNSIRSNRDEEFEDSEENKGRNPLETFGKESINICPSENRRES